jgi:hypothetical protein
MFIIGERINSTLKIIERALLQRDAEALAAGLSVHQGERITPKLNSETERAHRFKKYFV